MKYRSPLLSLLLLLASYITFSWFLYRHTAPWLVWLLVLLFSLLQALLLTAFSYGLRRFIRAWLRSDIGYFSVITLGAFSITVVLAWYKLFECFLMVLAAELLARLDLQNTTLNQWQIFAILTSISLTGLAVGWTASQWLAA